MDRFPEAFNRFERDVGTKDIRTFSQLFFEYQQWGGKMAPMTHKQVSALRMEAVKHHIGDVESISFRRKNKRVSHFRDLRNGRFISKKQYEEITE